MPRRRFALAGLSLGLVALALSDTRGQAPTKDPFRVEAPVSGDVRQRVSEMREGRRGFTVKKDADDNAKDLAQLANHLVSRVTYAELYDQSGKATELRPTPPDQRVESVFDDVNRFIIVPRPGDKLRTEQADYIKAFGVAMDAAINNLLKKADSPAYIRVNAGRMLESAARSGAPAHAPTIIGILKNKDAAPDLIYHALQAAANLLAAYDPLTSDDKPTRHTIPDRQLIDLIDALAPYVEMTRVPDKWTVPPLLLRKTPAAAPTPPPAPPEPAGKAATPPAGGKAAPPPPALPSPPGLPPAAGRMETTTETVMTQDQVELLHFLRRAAIRAMAQCRQPIVATVDGQHIARPMWHLAKIAVGDASVTPAPNAGEAADAVMGLCNYTNFRGVDTAVLLDSIAAGLIQFARVKTENPTDKSIQWKIYAAKMQASFDQFKRNAGALGTNRVPNLPGLADTAATAVLTPILTATTGGNASPPDPEAVLGWRGRNPAPTRMPFPEAKTLILNPAR